MPLCWLNAMSYLVMGSCTIRFLGNFPDGPTWPVLKNWGTGANKFTGWHLTDQSWPFFAQMVSWICRFFFVLFSLLCKKWKPNMGNYDIEDGDTFIFPLYTRSESAEFLKLQFFKKIKKKNLYLMLIISLLLNQNVCESLIRMWVGALLNQIGIIPALIIDLYAWAFPRFLLTLH